MPDLFPDAQTGSQFETSVRQVARRLYEGAASTGSIKLDGKERDEIIDTGTELIVIEATKVRKRDKVEYDLSKSKDLIRQLKNTNRFSEYNYRIVLVTLDEPTADQNDVVAKAKVGCPKEIISFTTLFSRLFDARHYLRLRSDHSFGSVRNPANDRDLNVPASSYIPTALSDSTTGRGTNAAELAEKSRHGGRFIIFGDYGSGKSMTLRDIYFRNRDAFIGGHTTRCPVYLNLREHIAQTDPDVALIQHAKKIGFSNHDSLISAWRSGYVTLFLDGFDELTPPQFSVSIDNLKQARRFAVELVKRFLEQTPIHAPIFLAGRLHYFDDRAEARAAIGFREDDSVLDLAGFTDDQVASYLRAKKTKLPNWLPTRPLLLGYLANSSLLSEEAGLIGLSPTAGWDQLLAKICEREINQIWGVGFDPVDLRLFIEGLASKARQFSSGARILQGSDLRHVFHSVFGRDADEPADLLTSRLPGLGSVPGRPGAREFIDGDFFEAAASGDPTRFIEAPFGTGKSLLEDVQASLGDLGCAMVGERIGSGGGKLSIALAQAGGFRNLSVTAADIIAILTERGEAYVGQAITISDGNFDSLLIDAEVNFSRITFKDCVFSHIEFGRGERAVEARQLPRFQDCIIDKLEGVVTIDDLPPGIILGGTTIETFSAFAATNDAVMESTLSPAIKVLLTILRKLFLQRGTGRQYRALRRGLPANTDKFVSPIVGLIKSHDFAEEVTLDRRQVIIPIRSRSADALSIINGPNVSTHALIQEVRQLRA